MVWPSSPAARDRFVLDQRPPRVERDPWAPPPLQLEQERGADGTLQNVATIFLTGRECPWRCAMCDLWQHTTAADTPAGAIVQQLDAAIGELRHQAFAASVIKLYNAGSFFDPRAVPEADEDVIAERLRPFSRVIVESHPSLVGPRVDRLLRGLRAPDHRRPSPTLEVAIGLETAHPDALQQLHKRMDVAAFVRAAEYLRERDVALRVFLLISPPFIPASEQDQWLLRSVDVALACEATAISLIPTRAGNGTIEVLQQAGAFQPPSLEVVERSTELAFRHATGRARVFLDLWNIEQVAGEEDGPLVARLRAMNLQQRLPAHA